MSNDDRQLERPTFDAVQLKDGSGYFVRVTWSDGFEQQINDFAGEAEARQWITDNAPNWHECITSRTTQDLSNALPHRLIARSTRVTVHHENPCMPCNGARIIGLWQRIHLTAYHRLLRSSSRGMISN